MEILNSYEFENILLFQKKSKNNKIFHYKSELQRNKICRRAVITKKKYLEMIGYFQKIKKII